MLDALLEPVGVGVVGDLYIGGAGLARGYVGAPALTASRFIADPLLERPRRAALPHRRSRPLAQRRRLAFCGRADGQVKIRGFRIEPGEIEAKLRALPQIADVAVIARGQAAEAKLVAYVATEDAGTLSPETLRAASPRSSPTI